MELMENIGWQAGDSFEPASTNIRPKSLYFNKNSEGKQKLNLGNLGKNVCLRKRLQISPPQNCNFIYLKQLRNGMKVQNQKSWKHRTRWLLTGASHHIGGIVDFP